MNDTGYIPFGRVQGPRRNDRKARRQVAQGRSARSAGVRRWAASRATRGCSARREDMAIYGQMMLQKGRLRRRADSQRGDVRGDDSAARHRRLATVRSAGTIARGYSRNRGELMSDRAFGHGGFTGTAMWIDPELEFVRHLPWQPVASGRHRGSERPGRANRHDGVRRMLDVPNDREVRLVRSLTRRRANTLAAKPVETDVAPNSKRDVKAEPSPSPSLKGRGIKEEEPQEEPKAW